jgi:hypothetical protein
MGNCVTYISKQTVLPGGEKLVRGIATLSSSYAASGDALNLSNYLDDDASPTVITCTADGYATEHSQGTAAAGTVVAYFNVLNTDTVNGVAQNTALYEVQTAADLSAVNVVFTAIGKAY